jgi:adenosine deaminase
MCPKSNLDTKTISKYEDLPLKQFIEKGILVSINTDDMTVSNTSLKQEYETLVKMGFNEKDLRLFAENSINASFANAKIKKYLLDFIE